VSPVQYVSLVLANKKNILLYWTTRIAKAGKYSLVPDRLDQPWKKTPRETRDGRPQLTLETEANGDSLSTFERGPSLAGSLGLLCQYKSFCPTLAA
jgi:hypothetical protein